MRVSVLVTHGSVGNLTQWLTHSVAAARSLCGRVPSLHHRLALAAPLLVALVVRSCLRPNTLTHLRGTPKHTHQEPAILPEQLCLRSDLLPWPCLVGARERWFSSVRALLAARVLLAQFRDRWSALTIGPS